MKAAKFEATQREQRAARQKSRFRDVSSIVYQAISGWLDHNAASMGAALAFYTLFAIAPVLVIAMAVAGYVFGPQVAETQVLEQLSALIGNTRAECLH